MKRLVVISAMLLGALAAPAAASSNAPEFRRAPVTAHSYAREARRAISPAEAKRIAMRSVRGAREAVDIRRKGDVYVVRVILNNGQVRDIKVDANTGRIR